MNEKYATLSLVQLKELAKSQGVKNVSTMRKAQLVQLMGELEEKYNKEKIEVREEKHKRSRNNNEVQEEKRSDSGQNRPEKGTICGWIVRWRFWTADRWLMAFWRF